MKHKHKHYDVLIAWLADQTSELQYRVPGLSQWNRSGAGTPLSHPQYEWRIKPNMVKVGRHEWPAPLSVAPEKGTKYFWAACPGGVFGRQWAGDYADQKRLGERVVHLTEAAAQQHADALVAINRGDIE